MTDAEAVVGAFIAPGEAGQPAFQPQAVHLFAPAGDDLVQVALVPYIPYQPVVGGIEDVVQGDSQFNDAEICRQVATGSGH